MRSITPVRNQNRPQSSPPSPPTMLRDSMGIIHRSSPNYRVAQFYDKSSPFQRLRTTAAGKSIHTPAKNVPEPQIDPTTPMTLTPPQLTPRYDEQRVLDLAQRLEHAETSQKDQYLLNLAMTLESMEGSGTMSRTSLVGGRSRRLS